MRNRRVLKRATNKRYLITKIHYCTACNLLHTNCLVESTYLEQQVFDPIRLKFKNKNINDTPLVESYKCSECYKDITNDYIFIPENIIKQYWELLQAPLNIKLNKNKFKDHEYIISELNGYIFDEKL